MDNPEQQQMIVVQQIKEPQQEGIQVDWTVVAVALVSALAGIIKLYFYRKRKKT